jgi:sugar phosphate isomerase/epimerase
VRNPEPTTRSSAASPMSRRSFLGLMGLTAGGAAMVGASGAIAGMPHYARSAGRYAGMATGTVTQDKLGIQLWTCLAEYLANTEATFQAIADVGYQYVEYAIGYGDEMTGTAKTFRKALDDSGLWCNGGHGTSPYPYDDKAWKQYVEDNLVIGAKYLGANINLPQSTEDCKKYIDDVHKGYEVARSMGFKGSLYNHLEKTSWVKLDGKGKTWSVEYILKHTSREVWNAEIDTAHAIYALGTVDNVAAMIRKYPRRFPFIHMKDAFAPAPLPNGSYQGAPVNSTPFGAGDFGRPDPQDPNARPHDGFQTLLTAIRETQDWKKVLLMAEADGSQATCFDYAVPAYNGLNGLKFPYRPRHHK